jgi:hypothetical protein
VVEQGVGLAEVSGLELALAVCFGGGGEARRMGSISRYQLIFQF